jgi:lipoic acid synthetase
MLIETLVGDFHGHMDAVDVVVDAAPDVFAHNVETVRRLTRTTRDARCSYDQSLAVLRRAHERAAEGGPKDAPLGRRLTKSSIMVGIGETDDEVLETMRDLRAAGVDVVTLGQYLRPTPKHLEVERFVEPATFAAYQRAAEEMGFLYAASGPLVRSSYRAAEVFLRSLAGSAVGDAPHDPRWVEATLAARVEEAKRGAERIAAELGDPLENAPPPPDPALVPAAQLVRRA